jgi:hypothetical protein
VQYLQFRRFPEFRRDSPFGNTTEKERKRESNGNREKNNGLDSNNIEILINVRGSYLAGEGVRTLQHIFPKLEFF